jgi:predicted deacylase
LREEVRIGGAAVPSGTIRRIEIPVARLPSHTMLHLPLTVVNGRLDGARLWLSAALHGDELNGMEIIRRVLASVDPRKMRGLLVAAPIVNVFGFVNQSRYLPDRRDLNRSFPGSRTGSLASRLARLFMDEVVSRCDLGIDLHTAAPPRVNLPQVRANLLDPETRRCAEAFGAPVMIHAPAPKGALRGAAAARGIPVLLYEAGEPLRFNPEAIGPGVDGVRRVMAALGMLSRAPRGGRERCREAQRTTWVRARQSGILYMSARLGQIVESGTELARISDPFGDEAVSSRAPVGGMVIGLTASPLVHRGDAIVHLASLEPLKELSDTASRDRRTP